MDYSVMAREYYESAEKLKKTISKYENKLKTAEQRNLEEINSIIASYRNIYYDVFNTARMLEERAKEKENAA